MSRDNFNSPAGANLSISGKSEFPDKESPFKKSLVPEIRMRLRRTINQSLANLRNPKEIFRNKSNKQLSYNTKFTDKVKTNLLNDLEKNSEALTGEKFEIYQVTFAKLIANEPRLFSLLSKIKRGYEEYIYKLQTENYKAKYEITKLQNRLGSEKKELTKLNKKLKSLTQDNMKFERFVEELNVKLNIQSELSTSEEGSARLKKIHSKVIQKLSNQLREMQEMKAREWQFTQFFDTVNDRHSPEADLFNRIKLEDNQKALPDIDGSLDSSYILPVRYHQPVLSENENSFSVSKPQIFIRKNI